jgi:hypothetical protein
VTPSGALRALLFLSLVLAACGDGPLAPPAQTNSCDAAPVPLPLGDTVRGSLEETDCLSDEGRLLDAYEIVLPQPTLFAVSLSTVGFFPHIPFRQDTSQVSGWASSQDRELNREHLFPAGTYVLHATSFNVGAELATAPRGTYTLFTAPLQTPQEGCGRETTVTYGSRVSARVTPDDCEAVQEAVEGIDRRLDGYTFLMDGQQEVTVTVTAEFAYRFTHWSNGQPILQVPAIPAGETREFRVEAFGFQDFYVVNENDGEGGSYTVVFSERPAG